MTFYGRRRRRPWLKLLLAGAGICAAGAAMFAYQHRYRLMAMMQSPPELPPPTQPAPASDFAGLQEFRIQFMIDRTRDGEKIVLREGKYLGGMNFNGKKGITVEAAKGARVVIEGDGVGGGEQITLRGLIIQKVVTPLQFGAVNTGPDWVMEDCIVQDNESLGVSVSGPRTILRRVKSLRNGYMGFGCGTPDGSPFPGPKLYDCESAYNNTGRVNPVWAKSNDAVQRNGLWYAVPGWEAGGGKFCCADGLVIERMKAHHNGGVGIWLDVYDKTATIRDCESWANFGVTAGWEGAGIAVEICDGPTLIENCYAHDNTGSNYAIWEARNITIRNCIASGNGLELRDIGGDRGKAGWFCQNVLLDAIKFYGPDAKVGYWSNMTDAVKRQNRLVEKNLQFGLQGPVDWKPQTAPTTAP